jgi:hypothetical protein
MLLQRCGTKVLRQRLSQVYYNPGAILHLYLPESAAFETFKKLILILCLAEAAIFLMPAQ